MPPFATHNKDGITWVDARVDAAFRKALMAGVPANLRNKMHEALAATPDAGAMAHSIRYFGDELESIKIAVGPLIEELSRLLSNTYGMPGFIDWLNLTNFGNDYRMIKVFKAWSEMKLSEPATVPAIIN